MRIAPTTSLGYRLAKELGNHAAIGMPDQHIGTQVAGSHEQGVQVGDVVPQQMRLPCRRGQLAGAFLDDVLSPGGVRADRRDRPA